MTVLSKPRFFKSPVTILTRDQLINRLQLIANVQEGQTINVTSQTIGDHSSWYSSWNRWLHSESRRLTLEFILLAESQLPIYLGDPELLELLPKVSQGLHYLTITYQKDPEMISSLNRVIEYVETLIPTEPELD